MNAYTPGPWHWINSETDEPYDFLAPSSGNGWPSLRTVEEFLTKSVGPLPKWILAAEEFRAYTEEENLANARLIAAAPDLLEAAKLAWHEMRRTIAPRNSFTGALDKLDATIAKVEGRS